jgi:hypothetical protein
LRELPPTLSEKAEEFLSAYGGLKGLTDRPIWVINIVLRTFFAESEEKEILKHISHFKRP